MLLENRLVHYPPFVRTKNRIGTVMFDVILAMLPLVVFAWLAHGAWSLLTIFVSILAAVLTELVLGKLFLGKAGSLADGSAIISGMLLAFTLSPFTPWYIVAFGASMAILFGKILWGGVGKNKLNPALVGREFMTAFFPAAMTAGSLWSSKNYVNVPALDVFDTYGSSELIPYLNTLFYKSTGAIGEHSAIFLLLGGLYLLLRQRISWHIPFAMLTAFYVLLLLFSRYGIRYSLGGVLLGVIFMATDMPSSPTTKSGKFYYGLMIGVVAFICLLDNIRHEYMSYSILILNGFSPNINKVFAPKVWGTRMDWAVRTEQVFILTLKVLTVTLAVLGLHYFQLTSYLVFVFIVYIIFKFTFSTMKNIERPI